MLAMLGGVGGVRAHLTSANAVKTSSKPKSTEVTIPQVIVKAKKKNTSDQVGTEKIHTQTS